MPHYLFRASYTPEAWAEFVKSPQNRREIIRPLITDQGGKLESFYFAFGPDDVFLTCELPSDAAASAISMAVAASGALRSITTTVLMTAEEAEECMKLAAKVKYTAPGRVRQTAAV
ncbi:MAG: GYD domain-containing protein [Anaerolineales bacterium]